VSLAVSRNAAQDKDVVRKFQRIPFDKINPYTAECSYFADCILAGRKPEINGPKNALHLMALTEKAYASYKAKSVLT
jgi:predicted dehydrogenase